MCIVLVLYTLRYIVLALMRFLSEEVFCPSLSEFSSPTAYVSVLYTYLPPMYALFLFLAAPASLVALVDINSTCSSLHICLSVASRFFIFPVFYGLAEGTISVCLHVLLGRSCALS